MGRRALIVICVVGVGVWGLGFAPACSAPPPLQNTQPSAEAVASAVLDALARKDEAALAALALDDAEFRAHVWPGLPASRPERNLPYSYVWGDLHQKSRAGLSQTLARYGGVRYDLRGVTFEGQTQYPGYVVHRGATMRVRDAAGMEQDIRVSGSMIEKDGTWKVFSYVVDD
jgi:hypothetical protein